MTIPTRLVLRALLADPSKELYGVEIGAAAGLPSGTVHPILARLETVGWLESRWEEIDPRAEGRPARQHQRAGPAGTPTWWASWAVRSASLPLPAEHRWRSECRARFFDQRAASQGRDVGEPASRVLVLLPRPTSTHTKPSIR
jgi:PadR family transcriptional regulator, regulatory protein PadR